MSSTRDKGGTGQLVLTPGGVRPERNVKKVGRGEAVIRDAQGNHITVPLETLATALDAAMAPPSEPLVLTPGGFRPKSLVHHIEDGNLLHADAGRFRKVNVASKKSTDLSTAVTAPPEILPALGSGWIVYAYWNNGTGKPISSFRTTWVVPPAPTTPSSQTIFLFNGIQNYGNNFGILQPVLQWGSSAAGGGQYWSVASWYVTSGGSAFHTTLVKVNVGQQLVGIMTKTGKTSTGFNYQSEFQGISGTALPVQNIAELLWCNETLEAYGINACTDYPATGETTMTGISIATDSGGVTPTWTPVDRVTDCGQHAVINTHLVPVHLPRPFPPVLYFTRTDVDLWYRTLRILPPTHVFSVSAN
jgi:hypothetical protein